jgi:hypothetical protein
MKEKSFHISVTKHECHSKTTASLKNVLQKPHAKLDAAALLNFAIHRRQNKTQSRKSTHVKTMRVHSAVSRGRLMQ